MPDIHIRWQLYCILMVSLSYPSLFAYGPLIGCSGRVFNEGALINMWQAKRKVWDRKLTPRVYQEL